MKSKNWLWFVFIALILTSCSSIKMAAEQQSAFQIPVYFPRCANAPIVKVNIEGVEYFLILDLGASAHLKLVDRALNRLNNKEPVGISRSIDINGNCYEMPAYKIPHFKLGTINIEGAVVVEESHRFIREGGKIGSWHNYLQIQDQIDMIDGRIGGGLFCSSRCVCYFDMSRFVFCLGPTLDEMTKTYALTNYMQDTFEDVNGLICLNILTDRGMKKFVLDTGASHSAIQKSHSDGRWVKMDLEHFGPRHFFALDIPENLLFDGILGIDFFDDYAMCLDFSTHTIYLKPTVR
jgi:uncharacterized protein YceK